MLSFVLFLVAVLLIVVIIKILPRRAWKWIGVTIGIVALISVAIVGYFQYQEHSQEADRKANLMAYARDVAFYASSHRWTATDIQNSPHATPQDVEYAKQHADELKDAVWMPDIEDYAKRARKVKGLTSLYVSTYTNRWNKNAVHLTDKGIEGVADVIILSDNYIVSEWEAKELADQGFKDSVFVKYYSLDGSRIYSSKKGKWIDSDTKSKAVFNTANEN
ncbi:TPA: hypothetical protein ACJJYF_003504 [Enterobacter cloacae]|uniref:hypothetical protein n=1 Tax=Enterobacter cloacae complex TaxID=354276 RepID=UPI0007350730|nr:MULTISPECIES: hypothetical protein [Enterobacter cloacae complex]KTI68133.1 hypothetical protein ASV00_15930 [Enterobacter cloacae subsp. cloacae]MCM7451572.1 hypothetical protein [Enterobacter cloacae]MDD7870986.1 hypothetical protein [Enterobacter cloacae complex sp. 2022EL-00981]RTO10633.1 hypothetical protein EKN72_15115 [Enterobacter cloacae]RTO63153.1 hypothetical protein EKN66_16120 [Enterobacter cloacae]